MSNNKLFRYHSSEELIRRAGEFRKAAREKNISGEIHSSPTTLITHYENFLDKDDVDFNAEFYGGKPFHKFHGKNRDQDAFKASFASLSEGKLRKFSEFNILEKLTGGSSTLDFLIADYKENKGGFQIPDISLLEDIQMTRCVSDVTSITGFNHYEVTIAESTNEEIDAANLFFNLHYAEDMKRCPTNMISFDMECIHISPKDFSQLPLPGQDKSSRLVLSHEVGKGESGKTIPARIILGGSCWILSIRFQIETTDTGKGKILFSLLNDPIQPRLAEFLENLPAAVGNNVKGDIKETENYIRRLGVPNFKYKNGFVETDVLGAVGGYLSRRRTMFNMNLQLVGGLLSKEASVADHKWGLSWNELPQEFQTYAMGDVRSGYNQQIILFTTILRDYFPDPDVVLMITKTTQKEFVIWFGEWLVGLLRNLEIDQLKYQESTTRSNLIWSIRVREPLEEEDDGTENIRIEGLPHTEVPGKLRRFPPERIMKLTSILPPWSSITFGGPRYLHPVRYFAITQLDYYSKTNVLGVKKNIWENRVLSDWEMKIITYDQNSSELSNSMGTRVSGLGPHPQQKFPLGIINPHTVLNSDITKIGREQKRSPRLITLEFGRIHGPIVTKILLDRASNSKDQPTINQRLWLPALSRYEEIRVLYCNMTGENNVSNCQWAEKKINKYLGNAVLKTNLQVEKLGEALTIAKRSLEILQDKVAEGPARKRVKLNDDLPPQPDKKQLTEEQKQKKREKFKRYKARKKAVKQGKNVPSQSSVPTEPTASTSTETRTVTYRDNDDEDLDISIESGQVEPDQEVYQDTDDQTDPGVQGISYQSDIRIRVNFDASHPYQDTRESEWLPYRPLLNDRPDVLEFPAENLERYYMFGSGRVNVAYGNTELEEEFAEYTDRY